MKIEINNQELTKIIETAVNTSINKIVGEVVEKIFQALENNNRLWLSELEVGDRFRLQKDNSSIFILLHPHKGLNCMKYMYRDDHECLFGSDNDREVYRI